MTSVPAGAAVSEAARGTFVWRRFGATATEFDDCGPRT
jgi:hypothetical protein